MLRSVGLAPLPRCSTALNCPAHAHACSYCAHAALVAKLGACSQLRGQVQASKYTLLRMPFSSQASGPAACSPPCKRRVLAGLPRDIFSPPNPALNDLPSDSISVKVSGPFEL